VFSRAIAGLRDVRCWSSRCAVVGRLTNTRLLRISIIPLAMHIFPVMRTIITFSLLLKIFTAIHIIPDLRSWFVRLSLFALHIIGAS
jgi:hypothetical protein